jgi:protein farnesyltransferase/geranylgeranyltransferase type-1 subunit alpha
LDPFNESPWRYLIGVLMEQRRWAQREEGADHNDKAIDLLREYIAKIKEMNKVWEDPPEDYPSGPCVSLLSALVDLLESVGDKSALEEANTLLKELEVEDPVRKKYWKKRQNTVLSSLEKNWSMEL